MRDTEPTTWRKKRRLSSAVQIAATGLPLAIGFASATALNAALPDGIPGFHPALSGLAMVVFGTGVFVITARLLRRRLLPLALLLKMSGHFQADAPRRTASMRRSGGLDDLHEERDRLEDLLARDLEEDVPKYVMDLVRMISVHDRATRGHSERVAELSSLLATELALPSDSISRVTWAGLLHDVGKLDQSPDLLTQSEPLTDDQRVALQQHSTDGHSYVAPIRGWLGDAANGVRDHHRWYDQAHGYPELLTFTGTSAPISLAGQIISVADAFDAMATRQPWRAAMSRREALDELVAGAGSQFSPDVVRAMLSLHLRKVPAVAGPLAGAGNTLGQVSQHARSRTAVAAALAIVATVSVVLVAMQSSNEAVGVATDQDPTETAASVVVSTPTPFPLATATPTVSVVPTATIEPAALPGGTGTPGLTGDDDQQSVPSNDPDTAVLADQVIPETPNAGGAPVNLLGLPSPTPTPTRLAFTLVGLPTPTPTPTRLVFTLVGLPTPTPTPRSTSTPPSPTPLAAAPTATSTPTGVLLGATLTPIPIAPTVVPTTPPPTATTPATSTVVGVLSAPVVGVTAPAANTAVPASTPTTTIPPTATAAPTATTPATSTPPPTAVPTSTPSPAPTAAPAVTTAPTQPPATATPPPATPTSRPTVTPPAPTVTQTAVPTLTITPTATPIPNVAPPPVALTPTATATFIPPTATPSTTPLPTLTPVPPTPLPTATVTPPPTPVPTATPTVTPPPTPVPTATPTMTPPPTPVPTATPTVTPPPTPVPTATPTVTPPPTPVPTATPTATPTVTPPPTAVPTQTPTPSPTAVPPPTPVSPATCLLSPTSSVATSLSTGGSILCSVEPVPGFTTVTVTITGTGGDADLYVRIGEPPTTAAYTCRPFRPISNESCTVPLTSGTVFARVVLFSGPSVDNLAISAAYS